MTSLKLGLGWQSIRGSFSLHCPYKNRVEIVKLFNFFSDPSCELPCNSELNNPHMHHFSGQQTTHLDCFSSGSIRVFLDVCAFLSMFAVVILATPTPQEENGPPYGIDPPQHNSY